MLPTNTPLGRLRVAEVLDAFDGPRLLVARSAVGVAYLGLWVDEIADGNIWLYVAMSEVRLEELLDGHLPLREAFLSAEDEIVFRTIVPINEAATKFEVITTHDINWEDLPPEDDYLERRPSRAVEMHPLVSKAPAQLLRRRMIERLYVDSATRTQALGQDVVAATWSAWFNCREASIRAQGIHNPGAPVAAGVAIGSFAVDLSIPAKEHYVRAVLGWAEYVKNVGKEDIHERLARCGINSVACEILLHNIIRYELQFRVTMLSTEGAQEPAAAFQIDVAVARELLKELRRAVPVLDSDKIPQANDLERVEATVRELDEQGVVDSSRAGIVPRQVSYYKHAARSLGLVTPSDMLTLAGRRLVSAPSPSERDEILRGQFATSECGWAWTRWADVATLREVDADSAEAFLRTVVPSLSTSTAQRRAQTLKAWHQRLFR